MTPGHLAMDELSREIEALLFTEGGSMTYARLARATGKSEGEVKAALPFIESHLSGSALTLVRSDTEASLGIAPGAQKPVLAMLKEEEERNVGDAGLEILGILLYEGPSTRAEIDYIRGVNSSSTLRNLLSRGLVERSGNPEDGREFIYRPTTELLAFLGVTARENLPEYGTISAELQAFKQQQHHAGTGEPEPTIAA